MNQINFKIQVQAMPDGTWHAEATAIWPEVKIFTHNGADEERVLVKIAAEINSWVESWPEHLRPSYKPPIYAPGTLVEHISLSGHVLEIVDGPVEIFSGKMQYRVKIPCGDIVPVLGSNLRRPYQESGEDNLNRKDDCNGEQ